MSRNLEEWIRMPFLSLFKYVDNARKNFPIKFLGLKNVESEMVSNVKLIELRKIEGNPYCWVKKQGSKNCEPENIVLKLCR